MSRRRREPPLTVTFRDAAGRVIGRRSSAGSRVPDHAAPIRAVDRNRRRAVVVCDQQHVLAVVDLDGVVTRTVLGDVGERHTAQGWVRLVRVDRDWKSHPPVPQLRLLCDDCDAEFDVAAEKVPEGVDHTRRVVGVRVNSG